MQEFLKKSNLKGYLKYYIHFFSDLVKTAIGEIMCLSDFWSFWETKLALKSPVSKTAFKKYMIAKIVYKYYNKGLLFSVPFFYVILFLFEQLIMKGLSLIWNCFWSSTSRCHKNAFFKL